jgi:putative acetyltransferase
MKEVLIRPICHEDNPGIAALIRSVLGDLGVPKTGTALADKSLDNLFEYYTQARSAYFVVLVNDRLLGGGGIGPLQGGPEAVCELQKMYFAKSLRGKGIGRMLLQQLLDRAKEFGYSRCYLETMPYMEAARNLYRKFGFEYLKDPMGDTGHNSCQVWMCKNLASLKAQE